MPSVAARGDDGRAQGRLSPALVALDIRPGALARRPPRKRQCITNADIAGYRAWPHRLITWPAGGAPHGWTTPETVVASVLGADTLRMGVATATMHEAVAAWSEAAAAAQALCGRALAGVSPAELVRVAGSERIGPPPAAASREEREAAAVEAAARRDAYCQLAGRLSLVLLHDALRELWEATRNLETTVGALPAAAWPTTGTARWTTPEGFHVVIGTPGPDRIAPGWHLRLDPGGDDAIRADALDAPGAVQASIDLGGDDHYESAGAGTAGGVGILSVLIDAAGDDAYDGGRWSVGGAAFGGAILVDRAGEDAYAPRSGGLGAALHGIALVLDAAGRDAYAVGVQGQGFGGPGGLGILWDGAGDDTYTAGGVAPDTARDAHQWLTMAQGCGFGLRPDAEGGTGILADLGGDDRYRGGVFAQGLGYWGGAGFLWDAGGDDVYQAVQYVQGTGLHFGLGVLSDGAGDDTYVAGGLAQGCGHDIGIGVCTDERGDDTYTALGLAAGAASAGGLGLFWDGAGRDRYNLSPLTNLGCDASGSDRPGFALHVDGGGQDRFGLPGARPESSAPARDGATWFTGPAGVAVNVSPATATRRP